MANQKIATDELEQNITHTTFVTDFISCFLIFV